MLIKLTDVLAHDNKVIQTKVALEMESFDSRMGSFDIVEKSDVDLTLTHTSKKNITIEAKADLIIAVPCDRCLEPVKTNFSIDVNKAINMAHIEEDRVDELEKDEYIIGYNLDVDKLIYDEILINWPMKVLCKESCAGICNKCGTNLNFGDCDCDRAVLDPRMAVIRDIFNNSKQ
ncbi:YceD family protein [Konateibacter massiliensis]|uniref:YceD family protein n=1 Tax=Konateibacter massiliensis TaxID=2002841 RepID=UPI000C14840B|nr:DUF177 domain-containing protein [Konateibacter massiliensis]